MSNKRDIRDIAKDREICRALGSKPLDDVCKHLLILYKAWDLRNATELVRTVAEALAALPHYIDRAEAAERERDEVLAACAVMREALAGLLNLYYDRVPNGHLIKTASDDELRKRMNWLGPDTFRVGPVLAARAALSSSTAGKDLPQGVTYSCTDPDENTWACSDCDAVWTFSEGGPKEHNMRYCPQCGKPIVKVVEYQDPYEDVPRCRVCGCTEDEPCEGGCYWVEDPEGLGDLCSRDEYLKRIADLEEAEKREFPQGERFYNSKAWRECRDAYFASQYGLCERCGSPGLIVHHKIVLTLVNISDPNVTLNWENLELLCEEQQGLAS